MLPCSQHLALALLDGLSIFGQFLLFTGLAFVVLALLASYLRFEHLLSAAAQVHPEHGDTASAFGLQIAARLGRGGRAGEPFAVVLAKGREGTDTSTLVKAWAATMRRTDLVLPCADDLVGGLIDTTRDRVEKVLVRVVRGVDALPHLGVATCPENGTKALVLVEHAKGALETVRSLGGTVHLAEAPEDVLPFADTAAPPPRSANLDEETGVLHERKLMPAMQRFIASYRREGRSVSVVSLAVDRVNEYRQSYGTQVSTVLAKGLAKVLTGHVRVDDLIARSSPEEFAVVLGCSCTEALGVAQRLAGEMKKQVFRQGGDMLKVTVSCGVAGYPEHGGVPRTLLGAAQAARAAGDEGSSCRVYEEGMNKAVAARRVTDKL